jgi:diguanylate cyclase (GGDEF)-like protein
MHSTPDAMAMRALARLAGRQFHSFAGAAEVALGVLSEGLPAGKTVIAQPDRDDDGLFRVIDSYGDGIRGLEPRSTLSAGNGKLDPALLRSLSVQSYLLAPLTVGGDRVGILCAMSPATDVYTQAHADLLTVCSRLLSYEWERVRSRVELRRLSGAVRHAELSDPDTGLPNRAAFLDSLEREWRLAKRGTLESHLVLFELDDLPGIALKLGGPLATLLLKDAAEVLTGTLRQTDCVGRLGDTQLSAVLVGCKGETGVEAFEARFRSALAGLWDGRPAHPRVSCGSCPLAEASSPEAALQLAGERARAPHPEKAT